MFRNINSGNVSEKNYKMKAYRSNYLDLGSKNTFSTQMSYKPDGFKIFHCVYFSNVSSSISYTAHQMQYHKLRYG